MKNNIEIYFNNEFIFPYMYLEYVKDVLEKFEKSALYFIMSTPKLKIINVSFFCGRIIISYQNFVTKKINYIDNMLFYNFNIPYKYIDMKTNKAGSYIEYGLTYDGIEYLKRNNPSVLKNHDYLKKTKISIYDLVMISNSQKETTQHYEVLYIGKSTNITRRLLNHEHILTIYRDCNIEYNNYEIMVMVLHPKSKLFQNLEIPSLFATFMFGNSEWEEKSSFSQKLSSREMLDISEALMIRAFKPKYNISFNKDNENITQKTYTVLFDAKINCITLSFNLFLQQYNIVVSIHSKDFDTEGKKAIMFKCSIDDLHKSKNAKIEIDKLDDKTYDLYNS